MIPLGAPATTAPSRSLNPTLFFAQSLKDALIARGITVTGEAVDIDDVAAELAARDARRAPRAGDARHRPRCATSRPCS